MNTSLTQFVQDHKLEIKSANRVKNNPHMSDMPDGSTHWLVTLVGMFKDGARREMSTHYSMGSAHKDGPQLVDVVSCLIGDARSVEQTSSFEEWASELGLDPDSRKAEATYRTCQGATELLKRFFGEAFTEALNTEPY